MAQAQGSNDVEAKRGTSGHAENNRAWLLSLAVALDS